MRLRTGSPAQVEHSGSEASDEAHLVACAIADPRAFEPLYRHYAGLVYGYCHRRLGTREAAEDATSLVFERALKALPTYRGGTFRGWVLSIAHHAITDSYRRTRPSQPFEIAKHDVPDPGPAPEEIVLLADERRLLQAALALLPPEERRVMELRLSGLRATEIAVALDRSADAVRQAQLRAIRRLQTLLGVPQTAKEARDA